MCAGYEKKNIQKELLGTLTQADGPTSSAMILAIKYNPYVEDKESTIFLQRDIN